MIDFPSPANHKEFVTTVLGANLLVPGSAGQRIIVHEIQFYNTGLQDIWFQHGDHVTEPAFPALPAGSGFTRQYNIDPGIITDLGASLFLVASNGLATPVRGYIKWRYVSDWPARIN